MNLAAIRKSVSSAIAHEQQTAALEKLLTQITRQHGGRANADEIARTVQFIRTYVEHVPVLLETAVDATRDAGLRNEIAPILDVAAEYFTSPVDLIPDQLGLVGLMDDAYLAHSLLQAISDHYRDGNGQPLLGTDLHSANAFIRQLIGEPLASQLDAVVQSALGAPRMQQAIAQLMQIAMAGGGMSWNDRMWGSESIDDVVNRRMGMLGIF